MPQKVPDHFVRHSTAPPRVDGISLSDQPDRRYGAHSGKGLVHIRATLAIGPVLCYPDGWAP